MRNIFLQTNDQFYFSLLKIEFEFLYEFVL